MSGPTTIPASDRMILRELAARVRDVAALEVMAERRELWRHHHRLDPVRPMLLVFPEGSWGELLPERTLGCTHPEARAMEWTLRSTLYAHDHFDTDTVVEAEWSVPMAITDTGWGMAGGRTQSHEQRGSWMFEPVLESERDLTALKYPDVMHDEKETGRRLAVAQDLFGGLLDIRVKGICHVSFHLMAQYTSLRGLERTYEDFIEHPELVHRAMERLTEGNLRLIDQYERLNLLTLNNDGTYHSSGGVGYTDLLPGPAYAAGHVRLADLWGSAESQELTAVSPAMHAEFAMEYEARLLQRFPLTGYGCCDNLTAKLKDVTGLPGMRRISVAPTADIGVYARTLGRKFITSWKPDPTRLAGAFDEAAIERELAAGVAAAKRAVLEIILKDTHTCANHPERFDRWTKLARRVIG